MAKGAAVRLTAAARRWLERTLGRMKKRARVAVQEEGGGYCVVVVVRLLRPILGSLTRLEGESRVPRANSAGPCGLPGGHCRAVGACLAGGRPPRCRNGAAQLRPAPPCLERVSLLLGA
ncbi:unnamed protein product [Prorocentrum cordatum]|uniref:Uncharacterized protein n=1 Tax=Prorocentrum cordatum TaxID=2364126 RepID=A0ABN9Q262_9DINO|nr:unnamed protein product [Polarella glacialis]